MAVNCWVIAGGRFALAGVTAMEDKVSVVTVRAVLSATAPWLAARVAVPAETVVTKPVVFTVATEGLDELQRTCEVIS